MSIEAMKQALEVLENFVDDPRAQHQIDAASAVLRQAIADVEKQEPVAWQWRRKDKAWSLDNTFNSEVYPTTLDSEVRPLYTHPQPKRELVCVCGAVWEGDELVESPSTQPNVTTSDMKQEHVDKTAKQRHEENT